MWTVESSQECAAGWVVVLVRGGGWRHVHTSHHTEAAAAEAAALAVVDGTPS